MLEEGIVVRIKDDNKALVELERKSACGACCACSLSPSGKMSIESENSPQAKPGDRVRLNVEAKGLVLGIILLYLLPALGLIFGIAIGGDNLGVLLGIIFMFFFFMIARFYGRKKVSYSAEILEIVKK